MVREVAGFSGGVMGVGGIDSLVGRLTKAPLSWISTRYRVADILAHETHRPAR
jgi:hypothetical protein